MQKLEARHRSHQPPIHPSHSCQQFQAGCECETEVRRVVTILCSTCGESFGSSEDVSQHWLAVHLPSSAGNEDPLSSSVASSVPTLSEQPSHLHETLLQSPSHLPHSPQLKKGHPEVEMEVHSVLKVICPTCGESFVNDEEAKQHWLAVHHPSNAESALLASSVPDESGPSEQEHLPPSSDLQDEHPGVEVRRVFKHLCPSCEQTFGSDEEVKSHWLSVHHPDVKQNENNSAATSASLGNEPAAHSETTKASLVEADEDGKPVIVRQGERTVVTDADGHQRAFGKDTVTSLLAQDREKLYGWMSELSGRHLRGLVNEISEQYFEMQDKLFKQRKELQQRSKRLGFAFFNLPETCSAKDLDNAYRRLARSMHPDKNGGTEMAKERFQAMRARYEELKEQMDLAAQDDGPTQDIVPFEADAPQCGGSASSEAPAETESVEGRHVASEANSKSGTTGENDEPAAVDAKAAASERSPEASARPPEATHHGLTNSETSAEGATNLGASPRAPTSSGTGATNTAAGQGLFYSRSRDVDYLQSASWKLLQQMKTLQQNLLMVEREFEKLLKDERQLF